ncbi:MAG: DUF4124 domain-containing protein [Proteobacteria bacterium]|nr:DUF4124 domain-containing protein [Pseudomonadota bacterium]
MKLLSFTFLMVLSFTASAIEFYQCTDDKGKLHFTNLPKSSLDSNCGQISDQYSFMLNQDYLNLADEFKKYEVQEEEPDAEMLSFDSLDTLKALEQLMQATEDRDDPFTRAMRGRSKAVEQLLKQAKP